MSLLSWNCKGLGKVIKVSYWRKLARVYDLSYVFLIETKSDNLKVANVAHSLRFKRTKHIEIVGLVRGIYRLSFKEWKAIGMCVVNKACHFSFMKLNCIICYSCKLFSKASALKTFNNMFLDCLALNVNQSPLPIHLSLEFIKLLWKHIAITGFRNWFVVAC